MPPTLVFGKDYLVGGDPLAAVQDVDAPLVFVGFGLVAPEHGRDDYRGLDVKGKIVVALLGCAEIPADRGARLLPQRPGQAGGGAGAWRRGLCLDGHADAVKGFIPSPMPCGNIAAGA